MVSTLLAFFLVAVSGCAQAEGEVCQVAADCMGGLQCCDERGLEPVGTARGLCRTAAACIPIAVDAGMRDAQVVDSGSDAGGDAEVDAGVDASAEDAGEDAGTDSGTDGGAADDAGDDAGIDGGA